MVASVRLDGFIPTNSRDSRGKKKRKMQLNTEILRNKKSKSEKNVTSEFENV
jgi:hypothetical protein